MVLSVDTDSYKAIGSQRYKPEYYKNTLEAGNKSLSACLCLESYINNTINVVIVGQYRQSRSYVYKKIADMVLMGLIIRSRVPIFETPKPQKFLHNNITVNAV